jgi:hypothetical protein
VDGPTVYVVTAPALVIPKVGKEGTAKTELDIKNKKINLIIKSTQPPKQLEK